MLMASRWENVRYRIPGVKSEDREVSHVTDRRHALRDMIDHAKA
jgi:hypothetical protein